MKIAISGKQCAGKSTAAAMIQKYSGAQLCKIIDKIYQVNDLLGVPRNRGFMQDLGELIRNYFGEYYFIRDLAKRFSNGDANVVVDDMRKQIEFDYVKFAGFLTIYIEADENTRRARAEKLGLEFRENHPAEQEIEQLKDQCDIIIVNNGALEDLEKAVLSACKKE